MESRNSYQRANKRHFVEVKNQEEKVYRFKVLLPNGMSLGLTFRDPKFEMPLEEFVHSVKQEYNRTERETEPSEKRKRAIKWWSENIHLEDAFDNKIRNKFCFGNFKSHKCHILKLHDGSGAVVDTFENMWDLTPDPELLIELPEEYTFETALADLIDNSLQAVWSNGVNERRLISVTYEGDRISIFDTGPGMDDSDEYSIVKWGKLGASLHRSRIGQAIGIKPPYLSPFFGMFGYGGPIASMHLGRCTLVSSKRKESRKVYTLRLERGALLGNSHSEKTWKTAGGIRNPWEEDIQASPQGSFTKVEIFELKMKSLEISQLQCKLKDIYFPYIQYDEESSSGRTVTPIKFEVNGLDLAEVEGGEVATTNLHSSNGPDFVLQLRFSSTQDNAAKKCQGSRSCEEANARLKCVYFPITEGEENFEKILKKLESDGYGVTETFENCSRVSIRRLGRLLPDARLAWLPFMDLRQKKGDKAQILRKCCLRVKCFIDTDAGFSPTRSKTDLAHHDSFTVALKNLGYKPSEKDKEINIDIFRDGKLLSILQLEREYQDWILKMHDSYDQEVDRGEDQSILVVSPNDKRLGMSTDGFFLRSSEGSPSDKAKRKVMETWTEKLKLLKGACAGVHKQNVYATLEYILLKGFQGDAGGDSRLICRPLGLPEENGCALNVNDRNANINIGSSLLLPIGVIDSGKCLVANDAEWEYQLYKQQQKAPSTIDILSAMHCQELGIDGALPEDMQVSAGHSPPGQIIGVARPSCFNSSSALKSLDQRYIVKANMEMSMEVEFTPEAKNPQGSQQLYLARVNPSSCKGFHGLYIFPVESKIPNLFEKAGVYTFSFYLKESSIRSFKKKIVVKGSPKVERWIHLSDERNLRFEVRIGACFPPLLIGCCDSYGNRIPFTCIPEVVVRLKTEKYVPLNVDKMKVDLYSTKRTMKIKDVRIESSELETIRPTSEATLVISSPDELFSVSIPCQVTTGPLQSVTAGPPNFGDNLRPGCIIKELVLEMCDAYGNPVCKGNEVLLNVDGLCFQDQIGLKRKVDDNGCVDLSGLLKVTAGYGENVFLSVIHEDKVIFNKELTTEKRELKITSEVPESSVAGSQLKNLVFEVVNSKGEVDETIHDEEKYGQTHTLSIKAGALDSDVSARYAFRHGRCVVPAIPLPQEEGIFCFLAHHSCHPVIHLSVEVQVVKAPEVRHENLMVSIYDEDTKLQKGVLNYGSRIGKCEAMFRILNDEKAVIKQDIAKLQASLGLESSNCFYNSSEKGAMMELIESKGDSAASFFCNPSQMSLSQDPPIPFMKDIAGLVALLGTVRSRHISRILAEYLGEDQMLSIVCTSRAAAEVVLNIDEFGNGHTLHALATSHRKSIKGRFDVICLEDVRPYTGDLIESDLQRTLALPNPALPTGKLPEGYLGYAANMIDIDFDHLQILTAAGHGLRETLFFRLFGELQVYETMEHLKKAYACIKHGAISLDGGIARGNGVYSVGYREPEIAFPVVPVENLSLSRECTEILKQIDMKQKELKEKNSNTDELTVVYEKTKKKFKKKEAEYSKFLEQMGPFVKGFYLEDKQTTNNS